MHANQHRSACEICRRHKLRCVRSEPSAPACNRCLRLELPCTTGSTRRIGRPTRAAVVRTPGGPGPTSPWSSSSSFDWLGNNVIIDAQPYAFLHVPTGPRWPDMGLQCGNLTKVENAITSLRMLASRIRTVNETLQYSTSVEENVHGVLFTFDGRTQNGIQAILSSLQALVHIIRAVARQSMLNSFMSSNHAKSHTDPEALGLIASCVSQLILYLERTLAALNTRLDNLTEPLPLPSERTAFADVPVQNFFSQCVMFTGMARLVLKQILVDLGMPTGRPSLTGAFRPGLCDTDERFKSIINAELGQVEGGWSVRPKVVLELMDVADDLVLMRAMEETYKS